MKYNMFYTEEKRRIMEEYTRDRIYDIMNVTQCNQANMLNFGLVGIWKIRIEKQHAFCYIKNRGHNIIN